MLVMFDDQKKYVFFFYLWVLFCLLYEPGGTSKATPPTSIPESSEIASTTSPCLGKLLASWLITLLCLLFFY